VTTEVLARLVHDVFTGARRVRDLTDEELVDVEPDLAAKIARRLHAASYSARVAARRFDRRAPRIESPHHPPCPCVICTRRRAEIEAEPEQEETSP
jgi:hypothetical protein